jgi:hypothetical protein
MRPPSPFRLILMAEFPKTQPLKTVECPRSIQAVPGAKTHARQWAADVGVAGTIDLEQRVGEWPSDKWTRIATADVHNSKITKWRVT